MRRFEELGTYGASWELCQNREVSLGQSSPEQGYSRKQTTDKHCKYKTKAWLWNSHARRRWDPSGLNITTVEGHQVGSTAVVE